MSLVSNPVGGFLERRVVYRKLVDIPRSDHDSRPVYLDETGTPRVLTVIITVMARDRGKLELRSHGSSRPGLRDIK